MELEQRDLEILQILRENGRLSNLRISKMTGIPVTSVRQRINRMERNNLVTQYIARLNYNKLGWNMVAYIFVTLLGSKSLKKLNLTHEKVAENISREFPYITHVSAISGSIDIILKIRAKNITELNRQVNKIRAVDGVMRTETAFSMHEASKKKIRADSKMWDQLKK